MLMHAKTILVRWPNAELRGRRYVNFVCRSIQKCFRNFSENKPTANSCDGHDSVMHFAYLYLEPFLKIDVCVSGRLVLPMTINHCAVVKRTSSWPNGGDNFGKTIKWNYELVPIIWSLRKVLFVAFMLHCS